LNYWKKTKLQEDKKISQYKCDTGWRKSEREGEIGREREREREIGRERGSEK